MSCRRLEHVGSGGAGFLPLYSGNRRAIETGLISVDDPGLRMRWIAERLAEQAFGRWQNGAPVYSR